MPIKQLKIRSHKNWEGARDYFRKRQLARGPLTRQARKRQARKKLLNRLLLAALVAALLVLVVGTGAVAWFSRELPGPDKIISREIPLTTRIYDRTGKTVLFEVHGDQKRTPIKLEEIPDYAKWATIVAEDVDFYKHGPISIKGLLRAVLVNITSGDLTAQGGSTISQQFVKNALLSNEKSYIRKIKEAILAWQLEKNFSKDEILELYFNEIPYGSVAYGIEAAAQIYFGHSARGLTFP